MLTEKIDCFCQAAQHVNGLTEKCESCGVPVIYQHHPELPKPDEVYHVREHNARHEVFIDSHAPLCGTAATGGPDARDEALERLQEVLGGGRRAAQPDGSPEEEDGFPEPVRRRSARPRARRR
jgi:hypothetical protein